MSSIAEIIVEIQGVTQPIGAQQSLGLLEVNIHAMRAQQCMSIRKMITGATDAVTTSAATNVLNALAASCFSTEEKTELPQTLQLRLSASTNVKSPCVGIYDSQRFANPTAHLSYFTKDNWDIFKSCRLAMDISKHLL